MELNIAKDFSTLPGGRHRKYGPKSGEEFREILVKKLEGLPKGDNLTVTLDGTEGYGSSFLEEAFGGLIRLRKFSEADLRSKLRIIALEPPYKNYEKEVQQYMEDAFASLKSER